MRKVDELEIYQTQIFLGPHNTSQPKGLFDEMPKIFVTTKDNKEQFLFEYYTDDITFTENEFVGLTIDKSKVFEVEKDKLFLQS